MREGERERGNETERERGESERGESETVRFVNNKAILEMNAKQRPVHVLLPPLFDLQPLHPPSQGTQHLRQDPMPSL